TLAFFLLLFLIMAVVAVVTTALQRSANRPNPPSKQGGPTVITECPDRNCWRDWLNGEFGPASRGELAHHLAGCPHCQRLLDDLWGGGGSWVDLVDAVTADQPAGPAFSRALNELKDRSPARPASPAPSGYPAKVDGYEVLGEIGRGGMGVVLKA